MANTVKISPKTHRQPTIKPIIEVRVGMGISKLLLGNILRRSGAVTSTGKRQGDEKFLHGQQPSGSGSVRKKNVVFCTPFFESTICTVCRF
ncbi:MAG: hypothetical protein JW709_01335 [Sedimentisphaerales bacterium]|nr:hypothetical protein [Sedimentisphaerales bacterium]